MRHVHKIPPRSFLFTAGIITVIIVGVVIPLGFAGTYEQSSWMPQGTGIDMPSPSANVFRPEMVIVTSGTFKTTLEPLAQWKTQKGTPCVVKTTEEIYAQYTGRDNAEKIRNYLKDLYVNASLKWVLLAGDNDTVPMRYVLNDDFGQLEEEFGGSFGSETFGSDPHYKPTDFYYSDLTGNWDTDGDKNWGERPDNKTAAVEEVDWIPDVYVGRFPSSNGVVLQILVDKTLNYEKNPLNDTWMNDFLLGGALSDDAPLYNDEAYVVQAIADSYVPSSIDTTLCIQTSSHYTPYPSYNNLTDNTFYNELNAGKSLVHFQGHGSTNGLGTYLGSFFTSGNALSLTNTNQTSLMFAAACSTGAFDISSSTLMESLLFRQYEGVIGYIGALRTTWYFSLSQEDETNNRLNSLNRGMARCFWQNFFNNSRHQPGKALADGKASYLNSTWFQSGWGNLSKEYERKNLFTYTLWGDPEVNIYTAQLNTFQNPLPAVVYAGQRLKLDLLNNNSGEVVPGATLCIQSGDFYYTSHRTGDEVDVRLAIENRTYNVTITGPNMHPYYCSFTPVVETTPPKIIEVNEIPPVPDRVPPRYTVNDGFSFGLSATDNQSGVGAVVLHVSYDNFETYANYSLNRVGNTDNFATMLHNFPAGTMQYYYTAIDYGENAIDKKSTGDSYYSITIHSLVIHDSIVVTGIIAGGLMGAIIVASLIQKQRLWQHRLSSNRRDSSIPTGIRNKEEESLQFV